MEKEPSPFRSGGAQGAFGITRYSRRSDVARDVKRVVTDERQEDAEQNEQKRPVKVSFSLPQITGGALAAATAAAIGSQLGVAGTIFGAAVASVVGGVAGTLYSAGIDRTHRKVTEAIQRGYEKVRDSADYDPDATRRLAASQPDGQTPDAGPAAEDATAVLADLDDTVFRPTTAFHRTAAQTRVDAAPADGSNAPGKKRVWTVMLLTVGAMFLVALAVITVVELGLGRALDGQNGTTVSQVVRPAPTTSAKPSPTPTVTVTASATPTATATETATPTPTPTASQTATQSPSPTATAQSPTPAATTGTTQPAGAVQSPQPQG